MAFCYFAQCAQERFRTKFLKIFWELFLRDYWKDHMNHRDGEKIVYIEVFPTANTFILEITN